MLVSLHIENIAVIERADIAFDAGLNVLTGETGAGKSIVIDAINAVLGERTSRDLIRSGSTQAHVSAEFAQVSPAVQQALEALGFAAEEDGTLLIQRQIALEGKGSCRINGRPATVGMLREVGRLLVNIHGQHENQALLAPENHVKYLDRLGGLLPVRQAYEEAYHGYCALRRQLKAIQLDESEKARRQDMLRYQIEEIAAAQLRPGEEEALLSQRTLCRHAEKIAGSLRAAREALAGDEEQNGAVTLVSEAAEALRDAARYATEGEALAQRVESLLYELEECAGDVRELADRLDFDQEDLERIENRLDSIHRLSVKYGGSEEAVLQHLEQAQRELEVIETSDEEAQRLEKQLEQAREATIAASRKLTAARQEAAQRLTAAVQEQLAFLDMPGVRLEVSMQAAPLTVTGGDQVEFLLSANPGEPPRSIARIASGGELSRIMLAMKAVLADADDIDTLIFDEVDTGISGRAAQKVGVKLREIAGHRQILCVTHLAQIAAQADHQLLIAKSVREARTYTEVTALDPTGRERELARIIGGELTPAALQAAREMLDKAAPRG